MRAVVAIGILTLATLVTSAAGAECGPADKPGDVVIDEAGESGTILSCKPFTLVSKDGREYTPESFTQEDVYRPPMPEGWANSSLQN